MILNAGTCLVSLVGILNFSEGGVLPHPQQGQALVYRLHRAGGLGEPVWKYTPSHLNLSVGEKVKKLLTQSSYFLNESE